jgi:pimeloyl-ACP methyl ester carboxylesterase
VTTRQQLPESQYADLDGPFHYVDFGGPADGPRVVCVHGLGGSHVNWLAVGPQLAETCRVVAVDLAGHGLTPAAGRSCRVSANRQLLDRFLTEVVGTPVILVGNSMGGMLSMMEAVAAPAHVAGLVLICPALPRAPQSGRPDPIVARNFLAYAMPGVGERFLRRRRARFTPEQLVAMTLELCCVDRRRVPAHVVAASEALVRRRATMPDIDAGFLEAARSVLRVGFRTARYNALLDQISQPVLLLHGAHDRLVPVASARAVAGRLPGWRLEVNDRVGHVPQLEDPDWTAAMIRDWLGAQGAPAAAAARTTAA